jgi:hypothetical protein
LFGLLITGGSIMPERRTTPRKPISYYLQVRDANTYEIIGNLLDLSITGLMIDSRRPIEADQELKLRIDLDDPIFDKRFIIFTVRSRWCRHDPAEPILYDIGFEIIRLAPGTSDILQRMIERYGKKDDNLLF